MAKKKIKSSPASNSIKKVTLKKVVPKKSTPKKFAPKKSIKQLAEPKASLLGSKQILEAIDREQQTSSTKSLDLSFNELASMHEDGELIIDPEYQRTFRWSHAKCSRFIESIVLEMPIPPIYVIESEPGVWELIDGLQRLSTYLFLRGLLPSGPSSIDSIASDFDLDNSEEDSSESEIGDARRETPKLILEGCDIVPELNGLCFDDLPTIIQHRIRRSTFRIEMIRKSSDKRFAYHMFQRLNTGGELLSKQELRNCAIRLLGTTFNDFIVKLAKKHDFRECISELSNNAKSRKVDQELVLRFFAFKNNLKEFVHDIDPFLTDYMERVTDQESDKAINFNYEEEEKTFEKTFGLLNSLLGVNACRRWSKGSFAGGFSISQFEAFSIGLAKVVESGLTFSHPKLKKQLTDVKKSPEFRSYTVGGGKNFREIYRKKIEVVKNASLGE